MDKAKYLPNYTLKNLYNKIRFSLQYCSHQSAEDTDNYGAHVLITSLHKNVYSLIHNTTHN